MQNLRLDKIVLKKQTLRQILADFKTYIRLSARLLLVGCISSIGLVQANTMQVADFKLSAVYIYRFGQFIQWSSQPSSLVYCSLGTDSVAKTLSQLINSNDHHTFISLAHINQIEQCHIVYISPQNESEITQVPIKPQILTVGIGTSFLRKGGMITLQSINQKVRPIIGLEHVSQSGIQISSKLLQIALLYPQDIIEMSEED
ncbi:TPA: YfiR family protein [Photobacterium damselae]